MAIGRYYLRRGQYVAAINRFRNVVERYQTTTHVPEALHRMTECYLALGLDQEAQKNAAVLGYNFPSSPWYLDSYALMNGGTSQ
jgi:outer membrane protein assembly factor BamD